MALTLDQFIQQLTDSGIMSADEIDAFSNSLTEDQKPADAEALAKKLISEKLLTPYQANAVWKGQTKGLILGNYIILDKIGAGGMGMVFKARHQLMKRIVALKVLPPEVNKDENAVKRFLREVEAAAKLTHPNIVAAHDADQSNGAYYLIMEYVDGQDLSEIVKKQGPATVEQAIDCILQAARGLEYAHQNGVIHRDIKPANLLLSVTDQPPKANAEGSETQQQSSIVKILDMGLARIDEGDNVDAATQAGLTGTGTIMGTVDYMSPEQAEDTKSAGPQADIFSLGASLYFLLLAKPIVSENTIGKKLKALMTGVGIPTSISEQRADVPPALDAVFSKMTAFEIADRYQSMTEVIADLEAVKQGGMPSTSASSGIRPVTTPRDGDSAMNSFLAGLEESTIANQTVMAPADLGAKTSDTFSESSNQMTRPALNPTQILAEAIKEPKKNKPVAAAVAVTASILVGLAIWAFTGSSDVDPNSNSSTSTIEDPSAENNQQTEAGWIDLMPQIDPASHTVSGDWTKSENVLTVNATENARLTIPYYPKGDYEFRVRFTREGGSASIALVFVVNGQQATYEIDAWGQNLAGIQMIDDQRLSENETRVDNRALENGRTYTALVRVQQDRVQAFLDGEELSDLTTTDKQFSLLDLWQMPDKRALGVGAFNSPTMFHTIEVRPLSENASSTISQVNSDDTRRFNNRKNENIPSSIAQNAITPADGWVELLTEINFKYDIPEGGGEWTRLDDQKSLRSPKQVFSRISVPVAPRVNYQLQVEFTRKAGNDAVDIFLPIVSRPVNFVFDGFTGKGLSGLQAVDKKNEPDPANNEGVAGFMLDNGRKYTAEFTVTAEQNDATIDVKLDGKPFMKWTGPIGALSLIDSRLSLNDSRRIGLGAWDSIVEFHSLKLKMLAGEAQLLRPSNSKLPPSDQQSSAKKAPSSNDLKTAEWVFSIGGELTIENENGEKSTIKTVTNLPEENFSITEIQLNQNSQVTDSGLANLSNLKNLARLNLNTSPNITDAGLSHLKGLTSLKFLGLYATQITDEGLKHLTELKDLETLILGNSKVTSEGIQKLQTMLPDCNISD